MNNGYYPWVWSLWVKTPTLKGADLLLSSACLPYVNPELFDRISKGKIVLLACPERENPALYGKIASIIRSSKPKSITVVTIDGSPHCLMLHASVNEAEYVLGERISKKHFVIVNGKELREISPNAVRVARYLHLVDEILRKQPEVLEKLRKFSLEYRKYLGEY